MLGQERRDLGLDFLKLFVRIAVGQSVKDIVDLGQKLARALEGLDRIGETRALSARRDGLDLILLPGHALLEGRHVVGLFDLRERRRAKWSRPFPEKRV